MPSRALTTWQADGRRALDEMEAAHRAIGRTGPGSRHAAQQITQAYVLLLSSWFQRFCRDLHSECVEHLVGSFVEPGGRIIVRRRFEDGRKLDTGNPNPGNIGSDFDRLGVKLWPAVRSVHPASEARQQALMRMNQWRNAVAHQDFSNPMLVGRHPLRLTEVRLWRSACEGLTVDFEQVMHHFLSAATGTEPW